MNWQFAALYGGLLFIAMLSANFGGVYDNGHGYPDCQQAPLNATSVRCSTFTATAKHIAVGLFWGCLPAGLIAVAMPPAKPRRASAFRFKRDQDA